MLPSPNGRRKAYTSVINESGLYELIFRSRKPEAKQFKKWVKQEVLLSIRKHGGYIKGQEQEDNPKLILAKALKVAESVISEQNREIEAQKSQIKAQKKQLEENLSVDGYRGFYLQDYLPHRDKVRLGIRASQIAKAHHIPIKRERREVVNKYGELIPTVINLYPKWVLDQAAEEVLM